MNQYQACLYSFECISHGDSKYGHENSNIVIFWNICDILYLSSARACRVESVNWCGQSESALSSWMLC